MTFGGDLSSHPIFKKILSLGYEFETHDIIKFSLHDNGTSLVNADTILRTLNSKISEGKIKKVDDNYLALNVQFEGNVISEEQEEEEEALLDEYMEAFQDESEEAQNAREYEEHFGKKSKSKSPEKDANFVNEYFNEKRKGDNTNNIKFQVTNDIGDADFAKMLKARCKNLTIPKNDMYIFKTNTGKTYDLKFTRGLPDCQTFSGVEYVVTYYNPKRENPNVVVDTFIDACSRVIDHLADMKQIGGELMIAKNNEKTEYETIGDLKNHRHIYNKEGTNLYYMDAYDDEESNEWLTKRQVLSDVIFTIQMTFRCHADDALDIMKQILKQNPANARHARAFIREQKNELLCIEILEGIVNQLFVRFDVANDTNIMDNTKISKTLKTYVFMILYKIYYYIAGHADILYDREETYLKDYLSFASRHSNAELYARVKDILDKKFNVTDKKKILKLFYQTDILNPFYEDLEPDDKDLDEEGNFLYGEPLTDVLEETDTNYGNPMYSLASYFTHIEENDSDWFHEAKLDVYSTTFGLTNDNIMFENRYFASEILVYLRNQVDKKISPNGRNGMDVSDMHRAVAALYGNNIKHMMNLKLDAGKKKFVRKHNRKTRSKRASLKTKKTKGKKPLKNLSRTLKTNKPKTRVTRRSASQQ